MAASLRVTTRARIETRTIRAATLASRRWHVEGRDAARHHSMASISPDLSVSSASRAASKRAGTSKYWRFGLPQSLRNVMTSCERRESVRGRSVVPQITESRC